MPSHCQAPGTMHLFLAASDLVSLPIHSVDSLHKLLEVFHFHCSFNALHAVHRTPIRFFVAILPKYV